MFCMVQQRFTFIGILWQFPLPFSCVLFMQRNCFSPDKWKLMRNMRFFDFLITWHTQKFTWYPVKCVCNVHCHCVCLCRVYVAWQGIFKSHTYCHFYAVTALQLLVLSVSLLLELSSLARGFCQFANGSVSHSIWNCHNHRTHTHLHKDIRR